MPRLNIIKNQYWHLNNLARHTKLLVMCGNRLNQLQHFPLDLHLECDSRWISLALHL